MESEDITVNDVVSHIQNCLLSEKYGIFIDGEAIACILQLQVEFYIDLGITSIELCECEEGEINGKDTAL